MGKLPDVELEHKTIPEKAVDCGDAPFLPAKIVSKLQSSQELEIGKIWMHVKVYVDVIHFEDMKGNFLGLIKTKA